MLTQLLNTDIQLCHPSLFTLDAPSKRTPVSIVFLVQAQTQNETRIFTDF